MLYSGTSNNGHIGTDHFVYYREVVLFQSKIYCHYIGWCIGVSFIQRCPLFRVSFIRGSTVRVLYIYKSPSEVTSDMDFNWLCQLRYYWEKEDCIARITNATVGYQYEYLGNTGRFEHTILTSFLFTPAPAQIGNHPPDGSLLPNSCGGLPPQSWGGSRGTCGDRKNGDRERPRQGPRNSMCGLQLLRWSRLSGYGQVLQRPSQCRSMGLLRRVQ